MKRLTRALLIGAVIGIVGGTGVIFLLDYGFSQGYIGCGMFGPAPCPNRGPLLTIESSRLNSPTNLTLTTRNSGTITASIIAYYVQDSLGNTYSNSNFGGPAIAPKALIPVNVLIDGKQFAFQSGNTYTVKMITSPNDQFTFIVSP